VSELHFEPADHSYTFRGVRVPSVTQILKEEGLSSRYFNDKNGAAYRGTLIHSATAALDRWEYYEVPKKYAGYMAAYVAWEAVSPQEFTYIETPMVDEKLYFAGTPDRVTSTTVWDIKTGKPQRSDGLQLAGYATLLGDRRLRRLNLYLHEDGTFDTVHHTEKEDFKVFDNALYNYNWKRSHK